MLPAGLPHRDDRRARRAVAALGPARQRVVDAVVVVLARVLHAHGDQVVGDDGPAGLRAERHGEELLGLAAVGPVERDGEQAVVGVQRVAVGGDPQVAVAVERQVVRAGDRADLGLVEPAEVGVGGGGSPHTSSRSQVNVGAGVVVGDLEDLAVLVVVARVGRVGGRLAGRAALVVVGQRDVDLAGLRVGLEVLGAVHLGGAGLVGGEPGEHRDLLRG